MSELINDAVQQEVTISGEVNKKVQNISGKASATGDKSDQTTETSRHLAQTTVKLKQQVEQFKVV